MTTTDVRTTLAATVHDLRGALQSVRLVLGEFAAAAEDEAPDATLAATAEHEIGRVAAALAALPLLVPAPIEQASDQKAVEDVLGAAVRRVSRAGVEARLSVLRGAGMTPHATQLEDVLVVLLLLLGCDDPSPEVVLDATDPTTVSLRGAILWTGTARIAQALAATLPGTRLSVAADGLVLTVPVTP